MTRHIDTEDRALSTLRAYGREKYKEGLAHGLLKIETIRGWLTAQPDRKWQAYVRGQVDMVIEEIREIVKS